MKTREVGIRYNEAVLARIPEVQDVENLKVGDLAPDCFGRLSEVVNIFALSTDIKGRRFVCYYTKFGDNGSISNSMKQGELMRTVGLTALLNSADCDRLEHQMNQY